MGFKKKLSFSSFTNNNDENKYWMLVWFGAITFNPKDREYLVDAYFIKKNDRMYYINEKIEFIQKLTINFRKSLIFPIGSIFDYTGRLNTLPRESSRGIMKGNKTIYIDNDLKGIDDNLKKSNFLMLLSKLDPEIIQSSSLYIKDHKNNYTIVPNYLLFKYFYYRSESSIKNIINHELKDSVKKEKIDNENYLFYNSKVIDSVDIKFLGKYLYTYNNFGEEVLNSIGNEFYLLKLKKKGELKFYFNINIIPFKNILEYSTTGFYLENDKIQKDKDSLSPNVFIVNDILHCEKYISKRELEAQKNEEGNDKFSLFTYNKIKYIDINKLKKENLSNNNGHKVSQNDTNGLIIDEAIRNLLIDNPENTLSESIKLSQEVNIFDLSPNMDEINGQELDKIRILINQNEGLKNVIKNINSNYSKEKIIEYFRVNLNYFELTRIALESLKEETNFLTRLFFEETFKNILSQFYEIIYSNRYYYIIESGRGYYSVILRKNNDTEMPIDELKFIYKRAIYDYKLNWSLIKSKNKFANFQLVILTPNKHKISIDKELNVDIPKTILKMKNKIKMKIENDD